MQSQILCVGAAVSKVIQRVFGSFLHQQTDFLSTNNSKCNEEVQLHSSYRVKNGHSQFDTAALSRVNVCPIRTLVGSDIPHGL